jgi:UPF0148 protein
MEREEAIEKMAKLLLSKATMLQYHCADCKSPLFEKEGRIICPICEHDYTKKEKEKEEPVKKALKKKKEELLRKLEEEKDPKKIAEIVEAIEKIDKIK